MTDSFSNTPNPLPVDTRGIVDPAEMMRHVDFARYPAGPELEGLVEWFWAVRWTFPDGRFHNQEVLNHPAGNISVGTIDDAGVPLDPPEGRVYGVLTELSNRHLSGDGWTVAARTTVGGLGVFLDAPAKTAANTQLDFDSALPGFEHPDLVGQITAAPLPERRVDLLREALGTLVGQRDGQFVAEARWVAKLAEVAEQDRSIRRIDQLADAGSVSVRTLQRLFDQHVGATPAFVIRRWRIIEAAEAARSAIDAGDEWRGWAAVAAELGYSDQAHLTRDFRRHLGLSPSAYLSQVTT